MTLKDIKNRFFIYRNGLIADTLRKGGLNYKYIFGLNLPQLTSIAKEISEDEDSLAEALWNDSDCRESRLLACRLFDKNNVSFEKAIKMMQDVKTREEADILCFWLLKHLPFASNLASHNFQPTTPLIEYTLTALKRNLE